MRATCVLTKSVRTYHTETGANALPITLLNRGAFEINVLCTYVSLSAQHFGHASGTNKREWEFSEIYGCDRYASRWAHANLSAFGGEKHATTADLTRWSMGHEAISTHAISCHI